MIVPGASIQSKCYPANKFVKLIGLIDANFYILWGSQEEKKIAKKIQSYSNQNTHLCNRLSLNSLIFLITQMDLVIGGDTGPTHMAWALNKPSIVLFGPTPGYRNTYASEINKIIESDSEVNPLKLNKSDLSIEKIDENHIAQIAKKILLKNSIQP